MLLDAVDFDGARVLELGVGDARLTCRYAATCATVVGIEPSEDDIATAVAACTPAVNERLRLVQASAMALPFRDNSFDIAVLAWSL
jgi:ubiquinone/menaquinone biosynthesis C-methylase UbiE